MRNIKNNKNFWMKRRNNWMGFLTDSDLFSLKIKLFCKNRYFVVGIEYHNDGTNKYRAPHVSDAED